MSVSRKPGWIILGAITLALILIPFLFWGASINSACQAFTLSAREHPLLTGIVLGGMLAGDVILPVPSSLLSTSAGLLLGIAAGTLVSFLGMTASCLAGYGIGSGGGRPLGRRLIGESELSRLEDFNRRCGDWMVIVARPVPVLAEASTLFAGMGRMHFGRYLAMTSLSNLAISAAYASVGATLTAAHSFLLAFAGAIFLPLTAMTIAKGLRLTFGKDAP